MPKFFFNTILIFLTFGSASFATLPPNDPVEVATDDPYIQLVEQLTKYANRFRGTPYVWGGSKPSGFDCSGFVRYVFAKFDMPLAHSSRELAQLGYDVDLQQAFVGDLIFFSQSTQSNAPINHVGIVVSNDENGIRFIHASTSRGVIYSNLNETYYRQRFVGVKRVVDVLKDFSF